MSENSNTETAGGETRSLNATIGVEHANEILSTFGVPMPDAADLDVITLTICASDAHSQAD